MGNDASKPSNRMAVSALAHMMSIDKPQLFALRDKCLKISEKGRHVNTASGYQLPRAKFLDAMVDMNVAMEPDYSILDKLFTMWDRDGYGCVDTVRSSRALCVQLLVGLCILFQQC